MGGVTARGEKGGHMANEPDMVPIRREKRERTLKPVSAGLTRRAPGHPGAASGSATSLAVPAPHPRDRARPRSPDTAARRVVSPEHPTPGTGAEPGDQQKLQGMAISEDERTLYPMLEGALKKDQEKTKR